MEQVSNNIKIAIKCDLSKKSGLGHFKRMYGLSLELEKYNFKTYFIFFENQKKIIKSLLNASRFIFLKNSLKKQDNKFIKYLKNNYFKMLIIDSYENTEKFSKLLKQNSKIKLIKISDQVKNDSADLIITNHENDNIKGNNFVLSGFKYALSNSTQKRNFKKKLINKKKLNVLIHGGGTDQYINIKQFLKSTFNFYNRGIINLDILVVNNKSKKKIEKIVGNLQSRPNYINYKKSIQNILKNYDIVCGPLGTTTFEAIIGNAFPFTVEPFNSKIFSNYSWLKNGHLFYLNNKESKKISIINDSWKLLLSNFKFFYNFFTKYSKNIDGLGNKRVANFAYKLFKEKINLKKDLKQIDKIRKAKIHDVREILRIRNQKNNRIGSSNSKYIITWPEHIKWWFEKNIHKYIYFYNNDIVGSHWIRKNKDKYGQFITSGWTLDKSYNRLNFSFKLLNHQNKIVNKKFKKFEWIVISRKNNTFVYKLNKSVGFKRADQLSIDRAFKYFNVDLKKYFVMKKTI